MEISIKQIETLLAQLSDLSDSAMQVVELSNIPDSQRRRLVGMVHSGSVDIKTALEIAKKSWEMETVPASERVERLLSKLIEATRSSDIAKIPTPLKRRDYTKPQKEYLKLFAKTSYLPGTQPAVERRRGVCA